MAVSAEDWLQAQYSVLGAALIEPELVPKVLTSTALRDYSGPCQSVYAAMKDLFAGGGPVDVVTISNAISPEYRKFLAQLMEITPSAARIDAYIALCKQQARVLALQDVGMALSSAEDPNDIAELVDRANGLMVEKQNLQITTMRDALHSFFARHTGERHYISWPIPELNDRLYAEPGDFIVLGGYPSSGKSALALQFAWHISKTKRVGFFSLETSSEKLFDRQMAAASGISMDAIKRNQIQEADWARLAAMSSEITDRSLELIPAAGMTVAEIQAVAAMRRHEIVIVDYLQLIQAKGSSRYEQVTNVSLGLHTMAQSTGTMVLALSQLSRASREADHPTMASFRESGQVEQDADIAMLLYLEDKDKPSGNRILRIAKNKEGTCPGIPLAFDGKAQTFSKAMHPGDVIGKYTSIGKKAKIKNTQAAAKSQFDPLPMSVGVPFDD